MLGRAARPKNMFGSGGCIAVKAEYDVFLSHKNLGAGGRPSRDAALAQEVYDHLSAQGLRVFLSSVTLEQLGVAAYKKAIDDALDSAQVLVAVGTSAEALESQWVRYEWESFFNDILSGHKPKGRVFSYVEGISPNSLPRTLRQNQVIVHRPGAQGQLYNFIANALEKRPQSAGDLLERRPATLTELGGAAAPASDPDLNITTDEHATQAPLLTVCPVCARKLRVPGALVGKQVKCPSCNNVFRALTHPEGHDQQTQPRARQRNSPGQDDRQLDQWGVESLQAQKDELEAIRQGGVESLQEFKDAAEAIEAAELILNRLGGDQLDDRRQLEGLCLEARQAIGSLDGKKVKEAADRLHGQLLNYAYMLD
jgi:hypothetical protein